MENNFHLCPEGERLFDEWHNLSNQCDHTEGDNKVSIVVEANVKWREYHDHRAACQECTKVKTNEKSKH